MGRGAAYRVGSLSCTYPPPRDVHATASTIARRLAEQSTGWAMITLALVPTSSACLLEVLLATWSFHKASL